MSSTVAMSLLALAMTGIVAAYVWPRAEARFEKLFIAVLGAMVGSLIGRLISNPEGLGHVLYLATGAMVFAAFDWFYRRHRAAR